MLGKYKLWHKRDQRFITPIIQDVEEIDVFLTPKGEVLEEVEHDEGISRYDASSSYEVYFYLGREDAVGTPICQGDIVEWEDMNIDWDQETKKDTVTYTPTRAVVEYNASEGIFVFKGQYFHGELQALWSEVTVIGNIKEHPHLL